MREIFDLELRTNKIKVITPLDHETDPISYNFLIITTNKCQDMPDLDNVEARSRLNLTVNVIIHFTHLYESMQPMMIVPIHPRLTISMMFLLNLIGIQSLRVFLWMMIKRGRRPSLWWIPTRWTPGSHSKWDPLKSVSITRVWM